MRGLVVLLIALAGDPGPREYARVLGEKKLDQATLDAEGYGEKKSFKREADGLRITLGPGEQETGWRTPPQLRFGGDFTVSATFVIKKLPKPAQEDGAAIGLAIAFGDINQPEVTLVRLIEPTGADVYRSIEKATANPQQGPGPMGVRAMRMMAMGQPAGKPVKPPRRTFPAAGDLVRMEIQREGSTVRLQIVDARSARPRYLGQATLGPNDVAAVKLFASNRNGAEAVNVLLRDFTIHAGHINGLGTIVRTVFDEVIYSDPSSIEKGVLTVGGEPKTPPGATPKPKDGKAANPVFDSGRGRSCCCCRASGRSGSRCCGSSSRGCRSRAACCARASGRGGPHARARNHGRASSRAFARPGRRRNATAGSTAQAESENPPRRS